MNGTKVYKKPSSDYNGVIHKAEFDIDASPEKCLDLVADPTKHANMDRGIKDMTMVERMDEDFVVLRTTTEKLMGGLISARDFVDIVGVDRTIHKQMIMYYGNIELPQHQVQRGFVRGITYPSAFTFKAVNGNPNKTHAAIIYQSDIKIFPAFLIGKLMPSILVTLSEDIRRGVTKL